MQIPQMQMGAETKFISAALFQRSPGKPGVDSHCRGQGSTSGSSDTDTSPHSSTHTNTEQSWAKLHPAHTQRAFCFLAYIDVNGGCIVLETRVHSSSTWQSPSCSAFSCLAPHLACNVMSQFLPKFSLSHFHQ